MLLYKRFFFIVLDNDEILNLVKQNDFEKLKILLQNQEDKNPVIMEDQSPIFGGSNLTILHTAAGLGHLDIIKGFKEELNYPDMNPLDNNKFLTPVIAAIMAGHVRIVEWYIDNEGK